MASPAAKTWWAPPAPPPSRLSKSFLPVPGSRQPRTSKIWRLLEIEHQTRHSLFCYWVFFASIPRKKRSESTGTMASLNLSINGPSIKSSYQGVINGPALSSASATAARWALFTVQAPLLNAFQTSSAKESILKVETTGGECGNDKSSACRHRLLSVLTRAPNRWRTRRACRRVQRRPHPVRFCPSQRPQLRPSQECPHRLVRGWRPGAHQGLLHKPCCCCLQDPSRIPCSDYSTVRRRSRP